MASPTRAFATLLGSGLALAAYATCGFVAYVLVPLAGTHPGALARIGVACLLPAIVLSAALSASLLRALRRLARQLFASRELGRWVEERAVAPDPELTAAARERGLCGRVAAVGSRERFSFVYGFFVPRIAISHGLVESLTAKELRAVLEHERYHVRHLDPLRALLAKTLSEAFFLLPWLGALRRRYEIARELAADRAAERAWGSRPLLGALVKALEEPGGGTTAGVSLADPPLLDARIHRLETGCDPSPFLRGDSDLLASALGAGSFLLLFAAAIAGLRGTAALAEVASDQLSAAGFLLAALCVLPASCLVALAHWRLRRRAGRPLIGHLVDVEPAGLVDGRPDDSPLLSHRDPPGSRPPAACARPDRS